LGAAATLGEAVGAAAALREGFGGAGVLWGGDVGGGGRRFRGGGNGSGRRFGKRERRMSRAGCPPAHKAIIPVGRRLGRRELANSRRLASGPTRVNFRPVSCFIADRN
jgi:hypothetical protein